MRVICKQIMNKFCIWNKEGEAKIIESESSATVEKTKKGLQVRIGKIKIKDAIGFTQISGEIQVKK